MQIQKSQMSKQFKALYPNEDAFNVKVWSEVQRLGARFNGTVGDVPEYLDDNKTFYNGSILYEFFYNKYETFWSVNSEERVHKLFVNALLQTLPALYLKTRSLTPEALAMLSPQKLLENLERRYNENPDTNYASTETAYSSTPSGSQGSGTWKLDNSKEKNITLRKDATIRVRELSNVLKKMDELNNTNVSGYIYEFINSIEFSSMWTLEQNANIQVVEGIGIDFAGALNGQVLAYDSVKKSYKWVNPDGSNTIIGRGIPWLTDNYSDLSDFENNGQNYEVVKYSLNKDGTNNAEGILLLVKVGSEVKEFRTWEEIKQYVANHLASKADTTYVNTELNKKANVGASYTKSESDGKYELKGQGGTNFDETQYFTHNSKNLTKNDATSTDTAEIGRNYKGNSTFSYGSKGNTWFGGGSASNTTVVHVGSNNAGTTSIGENTDKVLIGTGAKSNLQIGAGATGEVDIHFSENGVADKVIIQQNPADSNKLWVYIDGVPSISLRNIADIENRLALKADRANVDQNTADIAQLASEIQVIENTWTGSKPVFGGTSDLSTLSGDKGAFDFTNGSKLNVRIGTHAFSANDVKTIKTGTAGSFHIHGQNVDATFNVLVSGTGALTITDFVSSGTQAIGTQDLRIQEIEQNPKATAVIDAYTKAEADSLLNKKADADASYTKAESDGKYLTSHQDISGKADLTYVNTELGKKQVALTTAMKDTLVLEAIKAWVNQANHDGGYHGLEVSDPSHVKAGLAKLVKLQDILLRIPSNVNASLEAKANKDLGNVVISGNAGKILKVGSNGHIDYTDLPAPVDITVKADKTLGNVENSDFVAKLQAVGAGTKTIRTYTSGKVLDYIGDIISTIEHGGNSIFYRDIPDATHFGEKVGTLYAPMGSLEDGVSSGSEQVAKYRNIIAHMDLADDKKLLIGVGNDNAGGYLQKINADGTKDGVEVKVSSNKVFGALPLGNGNIAISSKSGDKVLLNIIDKDGTAITTTEITTPTVLNTTKNNLALVGNDKFVVWGDSAIQAFNLDGTKSGSEITLSDINVKKIIKLSNGKFLLIGELKVQFLNEDLSKLGSVMKFFDASNVSNPLTYITGAIEIGNGKIIVYGSENQLELGADNAAYQLLNIDGTKDGDVVSYSTSEPITNISSIGNGKYMVFSSSTDLLGDTAGKGQIVNSDFSKDGNEFDAPTGVYEVIPYENELALLSTPLLGLTTNLQLISKAGVKHGSEVTLLKTQVNGHVDLVGNKILFYGDFKNYNNLLHSTKDEGSNAQIVRSVTLQRNIEQIMAADSSTKKVYVISNTGTIADIGNEILDGTHTLKTNNIG